jgi:hypothetical protein
MTHLRLLIVVPCLALLAPSARAAIQHRVETDAAATLAGPDRIGARVALEIVPVDGEPATLELERFEVWHPDAELIVDDGSGARERTQVPDVRYFRGSVAGKPDSIVFLSLANDEFIDGWIMADERRFSIRSGVARREGGALKRDLFVRELDVVDEISIEGQTFSCALDGQMMTPAGRSFLPRTEGLSETSNALGTGTATYTLNLAVETDYELYQDLGSSIASVNTYIGNLVGAMSVIYQRELRTNVLISFSRVQSGVSDPWDVTPGGSGTWNGSSVTYSSSHALAELGDEWANAGTRPFNGPRSVVVLLSGKNQMAGVAWIGTACGGDFLCSSGNCGSALYNGHYGGRYAYCGGVGHPAGTVPDPNATVNGVQYGLPSSNYWSLLQLAHEVGHNLNSNHTHCYSLSAAEKSTYGVTRNYVDECYGGQGGCFAGGTSVPAEKGTIMSYCHLIFSGGLPQSRFIFGKSGEPSSKVTTQITSFLSGVTPNSPAISAPSSMASGSSANASISSPVGGATYAWTVTNGTINGSPIGTTINFTANANPVTLRATGTTASGCSASDFVNITVTTGCTFTISPTGSALDSAGGSRVIGVTAGSGCAWTAVSNSAFLTVTGGSSGSGNGTVSYSVAANGTGVVRTGTITVAGKTFTVTQAPTAPPIRGDMNLDGRTDLIWRNPATGQDRYWYLNGVALLSAPSILSTAAPWKIVGTGDFNFDSRNDLVWRNDNTSQVIVWLMNGATFLGGVNVTAAALPWTIQSVADMNYDGKPDLVWRNTSSGAMVVWLMNGTTQASAFNLPHPGLAYSLAGTGDFNGDGKSDLLWQHNSTGQVYSWHMDGTTWTGSKFLGSSGSASWRACAVGDFNADGETDIAWRNTGTGQNVVWYFDQGTIIGSAWLPTEPNADWTIAAPK